MNIWKIEKLFDWQFFYYKFDTPCRLLPCDPPQCSGNYYKFLQLKSLHQKSYKNEPNFRVQNANLQLPQVWKTA